jgi:zinc transporter ZupT
LAIANTSGVLLANSHTEYACPTISASGNKAHAHNLASAR